MFKGVSFLSTHFCISYICIANVINLTMTILRKKCVDEELLEGS
jgi:hypothetical protein